MRFQDSNFQPSGMFSPASLQNILFTAALLLTFGLPNLVFAQTAIGGIAPHTSAMLDIQSVERGVLLPRLTTGERDGIEMPATSLIIFNTTTVCLEINLGTPGTPFWQSITCAQGCGAYVAGGVWKIFQCHNLGANTSADPFTPSWELNGDYYQWGSANKAADGPTGSGPTQANESAVAGWDFSTSIPDGSWTDSDPLPNNPCPAGFRVPTQSQWDEVVDAMNNVITYVGTGWNDAPTNYSFGLQVGTSLFLPTAGFRNDNDGSLSDRGTLGNYWSSTEETGTGNAYGLYFLEGFATTLPGDRKSGFSVRCIKE